MKTIITTFIFSMITLISSAQLSAGDNVYLHFQDTDGEVNVDGNDACEMLKSYVVNKTSLSVVSNKAESDYTLVLYVIEKNVGYRKGKIDVVDSKTGKTIFESKWKKGSINAFYGYSGTRHAISRVFKGQVLKEFSDIEK